MPPTGPNGEIDPSTTPAWISVSAPWGGIAGYARREDVLGQGDDAFPVYAEDLSTVVGQVVPGKGFVPASLDPADVDRIPTIVSGAERPDLSGGVALYMRNDSKHEVVDAVVVDGRIGESGSLPAGTIGASCYAMEAESMLVLLDRTASEPGAAVIRELVVRGREPEGLSIWIVVAVDGSITQGVDVPEWWSGGPAC